jgi:hypothetical protein
MSKTYHKKKKTYHKKNRTYHKNKRTYHFDYDKIRFVTQEEIDEDSSI